MKLLNFFKKETKSNAKSSVQKLEKNQLEKVIGGGGPTTPIETEGAINTSRSNIKSPS